uniref:CHK kinase-like domain-containing protein n=1 Tax=Acrobeloides nanus TaxID=290746 RepID=A0A914DUR1_9BILA
MVNSQENILNTPFTLEFVLGQVKSSGENGETLAHQLLGYEVHEISGGSAFFSRILKIDFNWRNSKFEPKSIVLKVPGVQNLNGLMSAALSGEELEKMVDGSNEYLEYCHSQEIIFYKQFHQIDPTLKLPTVYYGHEYRRNHNKGLIIMEDLTKRATTLKMLPALSNVPPGDDDFLAQMKGTSNKLREIQPEVFNSLLDRAEKFFTKEAGEQIAYKEPKFGFPPAIVHGDLWSPNILFTKDENENASNELAAIIDWQSAHPGNPCEDIARLLSANTPADYRRSNTQRLLKLYKEKVDFYLGYELFTLDQLNDAYRHCLAHACAYFAFGAPMYHDMPSIIGNDPKAQQRELLNRVQLFFEDALEQYPL